MSEWALIVLGVCLVFGLIAAWAEGGRFRSAGWFVALMVGGASMWAGLAWLVFHHGL